MRPLDDVFVVSVEGWGTAPLCSRTLADLGARVIKVERPGEGDPARHVDSTLGPWSGHDLWLNAGKESLGLDLTKARGREILFRLIERADVLIENLRPGGADDMGLLYELIRAKNARIVFCHLSGYGRGGPYANKKAYDFVLQGESGLISLTGTESEPARIGAPIADAISGYMAAIAVVSALHQARRTGEGLEVDVSMLEATVSLLGYLPFRHWYKGERLERFGLRHPFYVPNGVYYASDGPMVIAAIAPRIWASFCKVIGRADLVANNLSPDERGKRRSELDPIIESIIATKTRSEWIELFGEADVPCGMVSALGEAIEHPQLQYRGFVSELESEFGPIKQLNFPAQFAGKYCPPRHAPPAVGRDTDSILRELGYDEQAISALRQAGVV